MKGHISNNTLPNLSDTKSINFSMLLGMRENRIVNFALFVPSFAVLYGVGISLAGPAGVSAVQVGLFLAGSLAVLLITAWLGRFLSKERIVTTIS